MLKSKSPLNTKAREFKSSPREFIPSSSHANIIPMSPSIKSKKTSSKMSSKPQYPKNS